MRHPPANGSRILVVTGQMAELVCGHSERMLVHHVQTLRETGFQPSVLTCRPGPYEPLETGVGEGIAEYRLTFPGECTITGLHRLVRNVEGWWRQHRNDFDAVVSEQPFVMWALLKAGCRLPCLQLCHCFAFEGYATRHGPDWGIRHRITAAAMRRLEWKVYNSAGRILVLSDYMRRRLEESFKVDPGRIEVVPAGIEALPLMTWREREQTRKRLGWSGPVVVTLRNLVPRTGVDMLVQAAAILRYDVPDLRWCVMGAGPLLEPLRWLAGQLNVMDIVEFADYLPEEEVRKRMQAADAFMLPTRALEGLGLLTLEANACGLPVVATPVGANPEVVACSPENRLAESVNPESLAHAVKSLLMQRADHTARASRLYAHVKEYCNRRRHDEAFIRAVKSVV